MNTQTLSLLLCSLFAASHAIAQAPDASGWYPLFDGKTLSGWTATPAGQWKVGAGGIIVGDGNPTVLFSPSTYTNLEIKAEVTINRKGNSAIFFRAQPDGDQNVARRWGSAHGYEADIANTAEGSPPTGSLTDGRVAIVEATKQIVTDDNWFTMHIVAVGSRVAIKVNDTITLDYVDDKQRFKSGRIGLQVHHVGTRVMFRNIKVRPLPADERAATMIAIQDMKGLPFKAK